MGNRRPVGHLRSALGGNKVLSIRPCAMSGGPLVNWTEWNQPSDPVLVPAFWFLDSTCDGGVDCVCIFPPGRESSHEQDLLCGDTLGWYDCSFVK